MPYGGTGSSESPNLSGQRKRGGAIRFSSTHTGGPLRAVRRGPTIQELITVPTRHPVGPTIMFVCHPEADASVRRSLEADGYHILEASNPQEAVELAVDYTQRHRPDLILIDLDLPPEEDLTAVRLVRAGARLPALPVVLISQLPGAGHRAAAHAAGCTECIAKPIDFDRLKKLLHDLLPGAPEWATARSAGT